MFFSLNAVYGCNRLFCPVEGEIKEKQTSENKPHSKQTHRKVLLDALSTI